MNVQVLGDDYQTQAREVAAKFNQYRKPITIPRQNLFSPSIPQTMPEQISYKPGVKKILGRSGFSPIHRYQEGSAASPYTRLGDDVAYGGFFSRIKKAGTSFARKLPGARAVIGRARIAPRVLQTPWSNMLSKLPTGATFTPSSSTHKFMPTGLIGATLARQAKPVNDTTLLGDDVVYGAGLDLSGLWSGLTKAFTSDTGKALIGAGLDTLGKRISPTDKASLAAMQSQYGMYPGVYPGGTGQYVNVPIGTPPSGFEKNLPYILVGGAALLGITFVVMSRK
jgi:hypothetical protein